MTITTMTRWRGGEPGAMADAVRKAKRIAEKYDTEVQFGRIHTGSLTGDWLAVMRSADWAAYAKWQDAQVADAEWQALLAHVRGMAQVIERNVVVGVDL